MKRIVHYSLLIITIKSTAVKAQTSFNDSILFRSALQKSIEIYHNAVFPPTALYKGQRYVHFNQRFREGHPFFLLPDIAKGYIVAGRVRYDNIPFFYDMVRQKIIVYNPAGDPIMLHNEVVTEFSQHGYTFIRIDDDSTPLKEGWYALLHNGRFPVLQKREKIMRSEIVQEGEFFHVDEKQQTYIRKDNVYNPVNSRKSVLKLFPDKQQELKKFISREKLSFKGQRFENSLLKLVRHYENITP